MKSSAKKVELASVDDLFSTEESRADAQREKVVEIPLSELHPFKGHPFKVKDDEAMMETADSIKQYGVLVPAIARPDPEGGYELVAGHRRHRASELAEKETMPVIVRDLDDDAATIIMLPFFMLAMYEKHGQPLEKIVGNILKVAVIRPKQRPYQTNNFYAVLKRQEKLPQGYDTVIGEGGGSLSGGERQRLSIARAMMKDAPIIILDEATANVDPENEKELMEALDQLTREKTVILIAHRLKTVRRADQILVVDKGRIVQRGNHEELLCQDGLYRRFVVGREKAVGWKL